MCHTAGCAPEPQPARDVLLRYELGADGKAGSIQRTSLKDGHATHFRVEKP